MLNETFSVIFPHREHLSKNALPERKHVMPSVEKYSMRSITVSWKYYVLQHYSCWVDVWSGFPCTLWFMSKLFFATFPQRQRSDVHRIFRKSERLIYSCFFFGYRKVILMASWRWAYGSYDSSLVSAAWSLLNLFIADGGIKKLYSSPCRALMW